MPLKPGRSERVISYNIVELTRAGYPKRQAAAIAFRVAGKYSARKARRKKKRK